MVVWCGNHIFLKKGLTKEVAEGKASSRQASGIAALLFQFLALPGNYTGNSV